MSDIFEETRELVNKSMIPHSYIAEGADVPRNWVFRFMHNKASTPNLAYTKKINAFIRQHISDMAE